MDDLDTEWLDKRLTELGLVVSALATGRIYLEVSLCLSDTNPVVRKQIFERFVRFIQLADHCKSSLIIGGVVGKLSGNDKQQATQYATAIDTFQQCAAIACESGVCLLVEPINRYETNFIMLGLNPPPGVIYCHFSSPNNDAYLSLMTRWMGFQR